MTRANSRKSLNNIKKNSTEDPAKVLDPTLPIMIMVYELNGLSEKLVLKQRRPEPMNISIVQHLHQSKNESSAPRTIL